MNILLSSVHPSKTINQIRILKRLGHTIFVPAHDLGLFGNNCDQCTNTAGNVPVVSLEQLRESAIDIVWANDLSQGADGRKVANMLGAKLVLSLSQNHTVATGDPDILTSEGPNDLYINRQYPKRYVVVFPPDNTLWNFDPTIIRGSVLAAIFGYAERYPENFAMYEQIQRENPEVSFITLQYVPRTEVQETIKTKTKLLYHVRPHDGMANSVMEALCCGVPVAASSRALDYLPLKHCLTEYVNAFRIDNPTDFKSALEYLPNLNPVKIRQDFIQRFNDELAMETISNMLNF